MTYVAGEYIIFMHYVQSQFILNWKIVIIYRRQYACDNIVSHRFMYEILNFPKIN